MTPGRILHCIPGMGGGGAERQLAYLSGQLQRLGWDVHVALVAGGPNLERLEAGGATIHRVRANGNHDPAILWRLAQTIGKVQPDVVQVWMLQMEILGSLAASLRHVPWIFSERCSEEAYPPNVKHRLRQWVATRASAVVSNSAGGDVYWQTRLDASIPRFVIPNALPLDEIAAVTPIGAEESGLAASERLVLFAGRLTEQKSPETLLQALAGLLARPHIVAVIAGEGPMKEALVARVRDLGLAARVRVPGYVDGLWRWMKRASVFVSPAVFEGHPNTVMEAAACGCPLVVSGIPAHREFLDESSALIVPPRDPQRLEAAIADVLDHPDEARARAARAASTAGGWSAERIAREYERVYFDVIGQAAANGR